MRRPEVFSSLSEHFVPVEPVQGNDLDNLAIEKQLDSYWCWASVALAVALFYDSEREIDQCVIACMVKGEKCCKGGKPVYCQETHCTDEVIEKVGHKSKRQQGESFREDVLNEYKSERPLVCRVSNWVTKANEEIASHAILLRGIITEDEVDYCKYMDPWGPYDGVKEAETIDGELVGYILTDKEP